MSRSLNFTACDLPCEHPCWRRLTEEEWEWLETHPNRQAFTLQCIEKEDSAKNAQQKDLCITSEQLTEQWKKGELPDGWYYVKDKRDIIRIDYFADVWDYTDIDEVDEVVSEVPSSEQWQAKLEENTKLKELLKECKEILYVEQMAARNPRYIDELRILIKRINQVLGEE